MIKKDYFSNKKVMVTFLLSLMVMIVHMSVFTHYPMEGVWGRICLGGEKIIVTFCEIAVPLFFVISGALFYRNYTYEKTLSKWKSRIFTLLIPYLIWNSVNMVFQFVCSYSFISNYFVGREKAVFTLENVLKGIFLCEYYGPFWFILDLIIFTVFCPVIYTVVKNKLIGGVSIGVIYLLYAFGISLPESIFYRGDAIIYYLAGAYVGVHFFDWFKNPIEKTRKNIAGSIGVFCISSGVFIYFKIRMGGGLDFIAPLLICAMMYGFWRVFDLLETGGYHKFQEDSFLVYATHREVISVVSKLLFLVLPVKMWAAPINYVGTIVISLVMICVFSYVLERFFPKIKGIVTGR